MERIHLAAKAALMEQRVSATLPCDAEHLLTDFIQVLAIGGPPPSGIAAQLSAPIAIAKADATAAKRSLGAIVELILESAVIGAIRAAAGHIDRTMIAKARRPCQRTLPIRFDDRRRRQRTGPGRRPARRRSNNAADQGERAKEAARRSKNSHVMLSDEITIDGASCAVRGSAFVWDSRAAGTSGRRTTKRDPPPSGLATSTRPLCISTAVLTR